MAPLAGDKDLHIGEQVARGPQTGGDDGNRAGRLEALNKVLRTIAVVSIDSGTDTSS